LRIFLFLGLLITAAPFSSFSAVFKVVPLVETDSAYGTGDVADDAAIWIHPTDPNLSTVIGHSKDDNGGIHVFDLAGRELQFVQIGKVGNLDIRYNFPLAGAYIDLVCAVNRSEDTLSPFRVNPTTRRLENVAARIIPAGISVYGSCMYHSPLTDTFYCFINAKSGDVEQWELIDNGSGRVDAVRVRSFDVGSQVEGCVADDDYAVLYIGEEEVGIWKYSAEPNAPGGTADRTLVESATRIDPDSHLASQVEGMALYYCDDGSGYLIASSQGEGDPDHPYANTFAVYRREGNNEYLGSFTIVDNDPNGIDDCTMTDGVDVTNVPLGPLFPYGMFVAHDQSNSGSSSSNYKYVPWDAIAHAFTPALKIDTYGNPRILHGDFNRDNIINGIDFAIFSAAWLSHQTSSRWNPACNLSVPPDDKINFLDLMYFIPLWLKTP